MFFFLGVYVCIFWSGVVGEVGAVGIYLYGGREGFLFVLG